MTFRAGNSRLRHGLKVAGAYTPPPLSAPTNATLPAITGTAWEGLTLSASTGAWNGYPAPTFAYQWKRAGTNISGATASTYQLVAADTGNAITVAVTATNSQGSSSPAVSSATATVIVPPLVTATPSGSALYVAEGDSITAGTLTSGVSYASLFAGTDTTDITFSNQAVSGSKLADIVSRASTIDALIGSNPGKVSYVLSVMIGTNDIATGTYYPSGSAAFLTALASYCDARRAAGYFVQIVPILPRVDASVSGSQSTFDAWVSAVNTGLLGFVSAGHADAVIDFSSTIMGTNAAASNTTLFGDGLHPTTTGQRYIERALSASLSALMGSPVAPTIASASITGTAQEGQTLTASAGATTGRPSPGLSYQWKRSGSNISGATASTYALVTADVGSTITVIITATNSVSAASATSSATATVTALPATAPTISSASITGTAQEGQTLTAVPGTVTGSPSPTPSYQWYWADTSAVISGATASTYTCVTGDVGHTIKVTITETNTGGSASATSSATAVVIALSSSTTVFNATPNPISGSSLTLSGGNLTAAFTTGSGGEALATSPVTSGAHYFEMKCNAHGSTPSWGVGVVVSGNTATISNASWAFYDNGGLVTNSGIAYTGGPAITVNTVVGVAVQLSGTVFKLWFTVDGTNWFDGTGTTRSSADVAAFTGGWSNTSASTIYPAAVAYNSTTTHTANFGGSAYAFTPPSGFSNFP